MTRQSRRLELLDVESKDLSFGGDQLSALRHHPRLRSLTLRGDRLRAVLPSLLAGVKSSEFNLSFKNTSIDSLPANLLFPVPRSTHINIDFANSNAKLTDLPFQLLSTLLEERDGYVQINGLNLAVKCGNDDCLSWKSRNSVLFTLAGRSGNSVVCSSPNYLAGRDLADDNICVNSNSSTTESTNLEGHQNRYRHRGQNNSSGQLSRSTITTSSEPVIIWTVAPDTVNFYLFFLLVVGD